MFEMQKIFNFYVIIILIFFTNATFNINSCYAGEKNNILIPILDLLKQDKRLIGHSESVRCVAFSPDGSMLASGSIDNSIIIWDVTTGKKIKTLEGHTAAVNSIAFSPDGRILASGSNDKTIIIWDVTGGNILKTLEGHSNSVFSIIFNTDGDILVSGSEDKTIIFWKVATGDRKKILTGHAGTVLSITFSPDGRLLASGSIDNNIILWDAITGNKLKTLEGHTGTILSVAFSPGGRLLASGSMDNTIILWDAITGEKLKTLEGHAIPVLSVAFSSGGRMLASGSMDKTIILWNVSTGKKMKILEGHSNPVLSVVFSPDGRMLASGSGDNTIILWGAAISPDKRTYTSENNSKTIVLWNIYPDNIIHSLEFEKNKKINNIVIPAKNEYEEPDAYEKKINTAELEKSRIKKEYDDKIKEAEQKKEFESKKPHPFSFNLILGTYDENKETFNTDVFGNHAFIRIPRNEAIKINKKKEYLVECMIWYIDTEHIKITDAFISYEVNNKKSTAWIYFEKKIKNNKILPDLWISSMYLSEPSGNGILDAEESGIIKVRIKNSGMESAIGVNLNLKPAASGVSFYKGIRFKENTFVGVIHPEEEKDVEVGMTTLDIIDTGDVHLELNLIEYNGFNSQPVLLSFKTKERIPPILQIAKVDIQDMDGNKIISMGKEIKVTLVIKNSGDGTANDVAAEIESESEDVRLFGESKVVIGNILSGEAKKVNFSFTISYNYRGENNLPISFFIKEKREKFSIRPDINLTLN